MKIVVGSRSSMLAQAQLQEVHEEIVRYSPQLVFEPFLVETYGDLDQKTSLRSLDRTDFFTREIDQLLLEGRCRIAIHSAKDLPEPLPKGIVLAAMTKGVDPSDSLVLRAGETLETLPKGALIATSCVRREEAVAQLRPGLTFRDLRGTIQKRLQLLETGEADGVVVAEAALIRLQLHHLNRIKLPGATARHQGRLAIAVRAGDHEMLDLFAKIDFRAPISPSR
jgi:hydroxymethylbilane synthase